MAVGRVVMEEALVVGGMAVMMVRGTVVPVVVGLLWLMAGVEEVEVGAVAEVELAAEVEPTAEVGTAVEVEAAAEVGPVAAVQLGRVVVERTSKVS